MQRSRVSLASVAAVSLWLSSSTTVSAQTPPSYCFSGSVTTTDGVHFEVVIGQVGFSTHCWSSGFSGVDIYRRPLGTRCGDSVRLTEAPLPWDPAPAFGEPYLRADIIDTGAAANTAYQFEARVVDAQRNPMPANSDAVIGFASTGEALIGHGSLAELFCGESAPTPWVQPCPDECLPMTFAPHVANDVITYVDTGTTLLLYGEVVGSRLFCNLLEPVLNITGAVPARCVVGVSPVTWGDAKCIYR